MTVEDLFAWTRNAFLETKTKPDLIKRAFHRSGFLPLENTHQEEINMEIEEYGEIQMEKEVNMSIEEVEKSIPCDIEGLNILVSTDEYQEVIGEHEEIAEDEEEPFGDEKAEDALMDYFDQINFWDSNNYSNSQAFQQITFLKQADDTRMIIEDE